MPASGHLAEHARASRLLLEVKRTAMWSDALRCLPGMQKQPPDERPHGDSVCRVVAMLPRVTISFWSAG